MTETAARAQRLLDILQGYRRAAVALSGGVDSAVVAAAAFRALGDAAIAVTADSPSVARSDLLDAARVAAAIGIAHRFVATRELSDPRYVRNDGRRCYHCKNELYRRIAESLADDGVVLVSGANLDDLGDYRPGLTAAGEHGVRHPLQEAGFTKADVRALAKAWELPVWDKPASPCLASRLAPGVAVTPERTARVEAAEAWLKRFGLSECRVRLHDDELARVEVPLAEIARVAAAHADLAAEFRRLGFRFVTLDLDGFRSGNLNQLIDLDTRKLFTPRERDR